MDKSFNDQELSDIMKEIEALEDNLSEGDEKSASPVMEELVEMDEEVAIPHSTPKMMSLDQSSHASKTISAPTTAMSFKVQGQLTLDLQFEIGGKVLILEVTEDGLSIEMDGGMKFSVPISSVKVPFKKAS